MAANIAYEDAKNAFEALGLHVKKRGRQPYSSNFKNVQEALRQLGCDTKMRRFQSWSDIKGPSIVKVDNGHPRNWHWVYATRATPWGLVVLDPAMSDPYLEHPPLDAIHVPLKYFQPKGNMLIVERPRVLRHHTLARLQSLLASIPHCPGAFPAMNRPSMQALM